MLRYERSRYIALGLPSLTNASLLVWYALKLHPAGAYDEYVVPFYLGSAGLLGLLGITAMIKRARDIGSSAWGILLGFSFAPPLMLLVAIVLIFIPSNPAADQLEAPSPRASRNTWLTGLALLVLPWLAVLLIRVL